MITLAEVQDLAAEVHDLRPDWDLVPTMNHLLPYRTMAYDELRVLVLAWAGDGKNRTPASLQWMRGSSGKPAESDDASQMSKEPTCHVCGHRRATCDRLRLRDQKCGIGPHEFETFAFAEANRAANQVPQPEPRRGLHRSINHDTVTLDPFQPPPDPTVRKCSGCGGTLAQDQATHHPGCAQVPA